MSNGAETARETASGLGSSVDSLSGFAVLGKTAMALLAVVAVILLCSWLLRRIGPSRHWQGQSLKVVGSTLLGPRERVVIVEVEGTWLVLGVTPGQISKLHELPAPPAASAQPGAAVPAGNFAARLAQALKHNLGGAAARQP